MKSSEENLTDGFEVETASEIPEPDTSSIRIVAKGSICVAELGVSSFAFFFLNGHLFHLRLHGRVSASQRPELLLESPRIEAYGKGMMST